MTYASVTYPFTTIGQLRYTSEDVRRHILQLRIVTALLESATGWTPPDALLDLVNDNLTRKFNADGTGGLWATLEHLRQIKVVQKEHSATIYRLAKPANLAEPDKSTDNKNAIEERAHNSGKLTIQIKSVAIDATGAANIDTFLSDVDDILEAFHNIFTIDTLQLSSLSAFEFEMRTHQIALAESVVYKLAQQLGQRGLIINHKDCIWCRATLSTDVSYYTHRVDCNKIPPDVRTMLNKSGPTGVTNRPRELARESLHHAFSRELGEYDNWPRNMEELDKLPTTCRKHLTPLLHRTLNDNRIGSGEDAVLEEDMASEHTRSTLSAILDKLNRDAKRHAEPRQHSNSPGLQSRLVKFDENSPEGKIYRIVRDQHQHDGRSVTFSRLRREARSDAGGMMTDDVVNLAIKNLIGWDRIVSLSNGNEYAIHHSQTGQNNSPRKKEDLRQSLTRAELHKGRMAEEQEQHRYGSHYDRPRDHGRTPSRDSDNRRPRSKDRRKSRERHNPRDRDRSRDRSKTGDRSASSRREDRSTTPTSSEPPEDNEHPDATLTTAPRPPPGAHGPLPPGTAQGLLGQASFLTGPLHHHGTMPSVLQGGGYPTSYPQMVAMAPTSHYQLPSHGPQQPTLQSPYHAAPPQAFYHPTMGMPPQPATLQASPHYEYAKMLLHQGFANSYPMGREVAAVWQTLHTFAPTITVEHVQQIMTELHQQQRLMKKTETCYSSLPPEISSALGESLQTMLQQQPEHGTTPLHGAMPTTHPMGPPTAPPPPLAAAPLHGFINHCQACGEHIPPGISRDEHDQGCSERIRRAPNPSGIGKIRKCHICHKPRKQCVCVQDRDHHNDSSGSKYSSHHHTSHGSTPHRKGDKSRDSKTTASHRSGSRKRMLHGAPGTTATLFLLSSVMGACAAPINTALLLDVENTPSAGHVLAILAVGSLLTSLATVLILTGTKRARGTGDPRTPSTTAVLHAVIDLHTSSEGKPASIINIRTKLLSYGPTIYRTDGAIRLALDELTASKHIFQTSSQQSGLHYAPRYPKARELGSLRSTRTPWQNNTASPPASEELRGKQYDCDKLASTCWDPACITCRLQDCLERDELCPNTWCTTCQHSITFDNQQDSDTTSQLGTLDQGSIASPTITTTGGEHSRRTHGSARLPPAAFEALVRITTSSGLLAVAHAAVTAHPLTTGSTGTNVITIPEATCANVITIISIMVTGTVIAIKMLQPPRSPSSDSDDVAPSTGLSWSDHLELGQNVESEASLPVQPARPPPRLDLVYTVVLIGESLFTISDISATLENMWDYETILGQLHILIQSGFLRVTTSSDTPPNDHRYGTVPLDSDASFTQRPPVLKHALDTIAIHPSTSISPGIGETALFKALSHSQDYTAEQVSSAVYSLGRFGKIVRVADKRVTTDNPRYVINAARQAVDPTAPTFAQTTEAEHYHNERHGDSVASVYTLNDGSLVIIGGIHNAAQREDARNTPPDAPGPARHVTTSKCRYCSREMDEPWNYDRRVHNVSCQGILHRQEFGQNLRCEHCNQLVMIRPRASAALYMTTCSALVHRIQQEQATTGTPTPSPLAAAILQREPEQQASHYAQYQSFKDDPASFADAGLAMNHHYANNGDAVTKTYELDNGNTIVVGPRSIDHVPIHTGIEIGATYAAVPVNTSYTLPWMAPSSMCQAHTPGSAKAARTTKIPSPAFRSSTPRAPRYRRTLCAPPSGPPSSRGSTQHLERTTAAPTFRSASSRSRSSLSRSSRGSACTLQRNAPWDHLERDLSPPRHSLHSRPESAPPHHRSPREPSPSTAESGNRHPLHSPLQRPDR